MFLFCFNQGLHWFSMGIVIPVMILTLLDFGFNIGQIGIAMAAMGTTVLLFELPTGGFADALGRKRIYILAVLFYISGYTMILFIENFFFLVVDVCLVGIGRALSSGTIDAWFIDEHKRMGGDDELLQKDLARAGVVVAVSLGAGTLLGGFLPDISGGFRLNIIVLVCFYIVQIFLTVLLIHEDKTRFSGRIADGIKQFPAVLGTAVRYGFRMRNVLAVLIATGALGIGLASMEQLWQPRLRGISPDTGTWLLGLVSAGYFAAAAAGSALSIPLVKLFRQNYRIVLFCFRLLMGLLYAALCFAFNLFSFIPLYFMMLFAHGVTDSPEMTVFNRDIPSDKRSSLLSLHSVFLQAGGALGSAAAGQIALHFSIPAAWAVAGGLLIVSSCSYLFIKDKTVGE